MFDLKFMNNHGHSEISNFRNEDCIIKIPDYIDNAILYGLNGCSLTDHEALTGHVTFMQRFQDLKKIKQRYQKLKEEGKEEEILNDKDIQREKEIILKMPEDFKICLGNEIYLLTPEELQEAKENYQKGITKFWHFILLAKDEKGYQQIKQISSESAWKNYYKDRGQERVPTLTTELEKIIGEDKGHIIMSSACLGSYLDHLIIEYFLNGKQKAKQNIHNFIQWMIKVFGKENVFLELQPCLQPYIKDEENKEVEHLQVFVNKKLIQLANAYDLNYQVTCDSHYLRPEHLSILDAFLNSDENGKEERETSEFYLSAFLWKPQELYGNLKKYLTEEEVYKAFEGTQKIHEMIQIYDLSHEVIVPEDEHVPHSIDLENIFEPYYEQYEYIGKFGVSQNNQDRRLLQLIEEGFIDKKQEFSETNLNRINIELGTIWKITEKLHQRLSAYYVLVRNIIQDIMWKVSLIGPARGSVTGFYIAYLASITQVNPLKYGLPEWRHLHAQRPELPDIDVDSESSKRPLIFEKMREYFGENNILNTLTLKTEKSKSTVLTIMRGMGYDNDLAQSIADMIPFERGANWTLKECFEGNEEKGRKPVTEFINAVGKIEHLKENLLMIEGLITGRSIHASAVYIFSDGYLKQNSKMKAPNGTWITAYNMHDSDWMGALKFDCLTISNLDMIHSTLDLLIDNNIIKDKGSIKANYDSYVHPDILDYTSSDMWQMLDKGQLINAFQFDTPQGGQTIRKVQPKSLKELTISNSLMRLVSEGEEQPVDAYIKFKNDISLWFEEMQKFGLNEKEIQILKKHLLQDYGVSAEQESVMEMAMDKQISGFSVKEANKLRKSIAKKNSKLLAEIKDLFYKKGMELGTRKVMLDYVWEVQFKRQFGYSFSKNHTCPYSIICLQEMNLAYHYMPLFWSTACLSVSAGANETTDNNKTTNYGKVAKAIGDIQKYGQKVSFPHINKAKFGFSPDLERNEIIFSLKGICGIGDDIAKAIIENRPYTSLQDFLTKIEQYKGQSKDNKFGNTAIIALIKAGAFDDLENKPREEIMKEYLLSICNTVKNLQMDNIEELKELGMLSEEDLKTTYRQYKFKQYVCQKKFFSGKQTGKGESTKYYIMERKFAEPWFLDYYALEMTEGKDYEYNEEGYIIVKRGSLDRVYNKLISEFKNRVLLAPESLKKVNEKRFKDLWDKVASGTISKWEMDSLSFYYHKHELADIDFDKYEIHSFEDMSPTPIVAEHRTFRGKDCPRFALTRICGTVLDKDKAKHIVTVLTPTGVVQVKFYKGQFNFYDKQISEVDEDGKKTVLERSWFTRGNKVLITGYRREEQFVPKKYKDSVYQHSLQLITDIKGKDLVLQTDRIGEESDEISRW